MQPVQINVSGQRTGDVLSNMGTDDRYLKLLCWNIQSLSQDVVADEYFNKCLNENDIIVLTETWLANHIDVLSNDFYNYHYLRPMHARARRPSEGISILIRHNIRGTNERKSVTIIKESDCFIWFKLDKYLFNSSSDIFICATYIPPEKSSFWNLNKYDPFDQLEQDLITFQNRGNVILIGDFNARTSNRSDYVTDLLGIESTEEFVRNSSTSILDEIGTKNINNNDTIVNPYGNKLLSLCKGLSLRIGRTLGDTSVRP